MKNEKHNKSFEKDYGLGVYGMYICRKLSGCAFGLMLFKPGRDLQGAEPIFYVIMGYYILSSLLATPFVTGCAGQKLTGVKKGLYAIIGAAAWLAGLLIAALPQLIR